MGRERWKLIQFASGTFELYDLSNDPVESTNLLAAGATLSAEASAAVARLKGWLSNWAEPPQLRSPAVADGKFEVRVPPAMGIVFQLQRATTAAGGGWQTVAGVQRRVEDGLEILGDPSPVDAHAAYRVIATVP